MDRFLPYSIIIVSGLIRLVPHNYNFTPILSAVSYGYVSIKNSLLSTLTIILLLFISDIVLHFINPEINLLYGWWMLYVYPIHVLNGFISKYIIHDTRKYINIGVSCTITSFNFWVLSNFGHFLTTEEYSVRNLSKVYMDGIPFLPVEYASSLLFSILFFGLHNLVIKEKIQVNEELLINKFNINL